MNIRRQSIFDKYDTHKDKISNIITVEKHDIKSKIRKVQLIYGAELYVPEEFVCIVRCVTNRLDEYYCINNFYDINYFEELLDEYIELDYTFINLNPFVLEPSNKDEYDLISFGITYKRDYDAFMAGLCTNVGIHFKDGKLMNLAYDYVYCSPNNLDSITENTVWIYENGEYVPSDE